METNEIMMNEEINEVNGNGCGETSKSKSGLSKVLIGLGIAAGAYLGYKVIKGVKAKKKAKEEEDIYIEDENIYEADYEVSDED